MRNFFVNTYRFFAHRQLLLWTIFAAVVILAIIGIARLQFVEDISSFLPQNKENARINNAYQHLGADNRIVVSIRCQDTTKGTDTELLTETATRFATQLEATDSGRHIKQILYEIDPEQINEITSFVVQNLPYFLEEEDYQRIDTLLGAAQIHAQLANDRAVLSAPAGLMRTILMYDPLLLSMPILQNLSNFQLDERYREQDGFLFNREGTEAIVVITSKHPMSETSDNALLIKEIDETAAASATDMGQRVVIDSFGASLVSQTNANQIKKDSAWAILLALGFILALLIYFYRNFRSIFLILCTIAFGSLIAIGFIVWFKNPVSIIALGVASIIIGIAINYPIHFLAHFKRTDNREQIIKDIVNPLLIGNITTVGAFLSLLFISSDAMRDLGLLSAVLLVGTILFVLIFLPHLLGKKTMKTKEYELSFKHIAEFSPEKNKYIVFSMAALTVLFAFFSSHTAFETDMHKINYMTESQRAAFDKLRAETDTNLINIYCVAEGSDLEQALQHYEQAYPEVERLLAAGAIEKASGISTFLPSQKLQQERLQRWQQFWASRREPVLRNLDAAAAENGFNPSAFNAFKQLLNQKWEVQAIGYFAPIAQNLASSYIASTDGKTMVYTLLSVDKKQKQAIETGLNQISENVFAFTDASMISRMVEALSNDFNHVLYICGFIVFAFLIFSFRRIEIAFTAFLPLTLAWIWILGLMGMLDIRFNIVNIILATFIFGQGDDYTIFVTEGVMYEYCYGKKMLSQFKNSIILSSSIMFIGIGMLIFAKHPAMRSLAEVTIIGMFSVVMMAYILPPLIFKYLTTKNGRPRREPITLWRLVKTFITLAIFFIGSVILTLTAIVCRLFFGENKKVKFWFHKRLCGMLHTISKHMIEIPFVVKNPYKETFEKPAVVIANHESFADLLFGLSITPKMIAMTNQRGWNSILLRHFIRYSDYLPNDADMADNLDKLQELIKDGYSILIFPEGTRSVDQSILRFHQGAFYIADKLNVDILPMVMHGMGHVWPKKECLQYSGQVTISIEKRIHPDDNRLRHGKPPLEQARLFRQYYREKHHELALSIETPGYYKDLVWHNYLYKGREVQRRTQRTLKNWNAIEQQIGQMPDEGTLLIHSHDQGEVALLAALVKKQLQITSVIENDDDRAVAENCAAVPNNLRFTARVEPYQSFDMIIK